MWSAPATFQQLDNQVLGVTGYEAYLDDVVFYSDIWKQQVSQLEEVFCRLGATKLTLSLKREFGHAIITHFGKIVVCGVVKSVEAKVEGILNFGAPSSRR